MMSSDLKYGNFSEDGSRYTVTELLPPRDFNNVIANSTGYLAEISQWGPASASFQFANSEVNTVTEKLGKLLYLRDDETMDVWTPGSFPMMSKVDQYACTHEDTATTVTSLYQGIRVSWRSTVFDDISGESWEVHLTNHSDRLRTISVVPAVRLRLEGFPAPRFFDEQAQYSVCSFNPAINGMYYNSRNPNALDRRYSAVLVSAQPVASYTGRREEFFGSPDSNAYPHQLFHSSELDRCNGIAGEPFQALLCRTQLAPGDTVRLHFYFGIVENQEAADQIVEKWSRNPASANESQWEALSQRRSRLKITTPDRTLNAFVNTWLKKGLEYGMRKKDASRDNLQFAYGLTMADPERVYGELIQAMQYQYRDGHTVRSWKPLDTTYYCDGPLWIVLSVCKYLKFTNDIQFLEREVPFYDGEAGSVLQHLVRAVSRIETDCGPHKLPLMRFADWNDALNIDHPQAESVFMAMGLGVMLNEMAHLMRALQKPEEEQLYRAKFLSLKQIVNETCWDEAGGYYVRALAGDEVIGGSGSRGSKLFVNPQTWSIISGIVTEERLPQVLTCIDEQIETEIGCPVNIPAYTSYIPRYGRITAQLPGTWENGASYCHVTSFKAYADTCIGRGNKAYKSILQIMPDAEGNPLENSGALPYALTSSYCTNPDIYGKAGRPWLTGTQAWMMSSVIEGLLGIHLDYGGFVLQPALPTGWAEASIMLQRDQDLYRFHYHNRSGTNQSSDKGRPTIAVNGKELAGNRISFAEPNTITTVELWV